MRSTRCAPPPQWPLSVLAAACALLALAAPTARGQDTAAPAVAVATAAELAAAVDGGVAHIVVTDHLDLSDLPVFDFQGEPTTDDNPDRVTFVNAAVSLELASIRVCPSQHEVPVRLRLVTRTVSSVQGSLHHLHLYAVHMYTVGGRTRTRLRLVTRTVLALLPACITAAAKAARRC